MPLPKSPSKHTSSLNSPGIGTSFAQREPDDFELTDELAETLNEYEEPDNEDDDEELPSPTTSVPLPKHTLSVSDKNTTHTSKEQREVLQQIKAEVVVDEVAKDIPDISLSEEEEDDELPTTSISQMKPTPKVGTAFVHRDKAREAYDVRIKVYEVITLLEIGEVDAPTIELLAGAVDSVREVSFDENFDVREELKTQMRLVQAARAAVLTAGGKIADGTTVQEVKSVLDSSMRLIGLLSKTNKEMITMERIQAVEASFLEAVTELPMEQQKKFVDTLERRMRVQAELRKTG